MTCLEETSMATDENAVGDRASGEITVDHHRRGHLDPGDMELSGEEHTPKARKPYTITKQREKWSEEEHRLFLEALQLHGRAWRRIQEHIGTKTAVQIRSHAQKFFSKVVRESSGSSGGPGAAPAIQIPPPRPKRKPAHPYPRKADGGAAKKHAPALKQLEKPPSRMQSLREQDDGSPTSVLTAAQTVLQADASGGAFSNCSSGSGSPGPSAAGSDERGDGGGSPASSDGCQSPSVATVDLDARAPNAKAFGDAKGVSYVNGSEAPVFRLFGKRVVVKDCNDHLQRDLSMHASAGSLARLAGGMPPAGAAEGSSSWNPWPSSVQHLMYFVPQADGFAAQSSVVPWLGYNGGLPCALFYRQAVASSRQAQDHKVAQREGSLTGSNTASSAVAAPAAAAAAAAAQSSDAGAESHGAQRENTGESGAAPAAPRLMERLGSSASCSRRGFVPYKRCAAESEAPPRSAAAAGEEADGELTRLCL
ncbi:hypothetical protein ACP4OV_000680 [Aristida adscensionis]